ncbi:MAG TPA: radical SAM family heme chaperone HemW [Thermoanaerobaculia bacterium]|nr:radical SAM family heme chaperone HemW [Thermoanaerobaculia bacterium]
MTTPGAPDPTGIYVHLPFCRVKCSYCAFAVSTDLRLEDAYGEALLREIERRAPRGAPADTLFWGGGTPSRSAFAWLARFDGAIRDRFALAPDAEVTLEANPEDVDARSIAAWSALGVNRLSIGVQSLHEDELRPLGRIHGRARALEALDAAVASGLRTSADLILGLPGQTVASCLETVDGVLRAGVGHLSMYMLDLEPGSALESRVARGVVELPDDEDVAAMYLAAIERAAAAGLEQYEISNFAREGERSTHNLRYWERRSYAGFGAGAHSFEGATRKGNTKDVRGYIDAIGRGEEPVVMIEDLDARAVAHERIFLALRRTEGIGYPDLIEWADGDGRGWCERGMEQGWLEMIGERIRFTPRGFLVSSELVAQLF